MLKYVFYNHCFSTQVHTRTHSGEKPYKCRICGEGFAQYGTVQRHERTHAETSTGKTHICDTCGRAFDRKDALLRHKKVHAQDKIIKCKICHIIFENKMQLALHTSKHAKRRGKPDASLKENANICDICGKWFNKLTKLQRHKKTHEAEKKNICKVCGENFDTKMELLIHKSRSKLCKPSSK